MVIFNRGIKWVIWMSGPLFYNFAPTFVWKNWSILAVLLPPVTAQAILKQNNQKKWIFSNECVSKVVEERLLFCECLRDPSLNPINHWTPQNTGKHCNSHPSRCGTLKVWNYVIFHLKWVFSQLYTTSVWKQWHFTGGDVWKKHSLQLNCCCKNITKIALGSL